MPELREKLQARLSGSYTLGRELSGGGMSRVFVAEDAALGRAVVVKVLAPDLAAGLNAERFKREIMLAAQLQHPHIVPVLSSGMADELPYFVMPFVVGESLRNRLLDEHGMPIVEIVSILRDVAKALAFAHAQGVVHRDIKPDNVLLAGGSAVVTDFGIAKAISSALVAAPGGTLTQVGTSLGTPAYMSPEQAAGDPNADARSDFYSFGAMAYEMVCGKTPFHDRAPHALIMAHIAEPPEPIERLVPAVPPQLALVIMRCLSKNPADRPSSAKEILEDLDDIDLSGQRVRSGPHDSASAGANSVRVDTGENAYRDGTIIAPSPIASIAKKRSITPFVIGGAVLLLAIGGFFFNRNRNKSTTSSIDDNAIAVVPFRVASADASLHYLREGMVDLIASKLSGEEMRAVDPRILIDAWHQAGGSENADLSREATLKLAQQLNAGRALLGDVVGSPNHLTLTVSLLDVPSGTQRARVTVEGPPDSLSSLVNQIATQLLTQTSGEASARIASLTSTSLPALRAYLDGQANLRKGSAFAAAKDFDHALKEDSTFALAGLGLKQATSWYGDQVLADRGLAIAWRERAKLSPRDQALLTAVAGPRYPGRSSNLEILKAREQYLNIAPDNAEAWYLVADQTFHFGSAMGITNWEKQALAGFKKAMDLDSTYLPGYSHAMPLAPSMGDSAFLERATRIRSALDTSSFWRVQNDWYNAVRRGDTTEAEMVFMRLGKNPEPILNGLVRLTVFDGTGASDTKRALDQYMELSPTDVIRKSRARYGHDVSLMLGRPAEALRYLALSRDSAGDYNIPILTIRDAFMGAIPQSEGVAAAAALARYEMAPEPADSAHREIQRAVIRMMEPWRISHGDTSMTRRSIQRLRSLSRTVVPGERLPAQTEIAFIEMLFADASNSPSLRATAERVDSLLLQQDFSQIHTGRSAQTALGVAHVFEKLGDFKRAEIVAGRYAVWESDSMPYLAIQLREQGRLALKAGDKWRAKRAYGHYLGMRAVAEPTEAANIAAVRRELAALR